MGGKRGAYTMASMAPPPLFTAEDLLGDDFDFTVCRDGWLYRRTRRILSRIWNAHHELLAERPAQFVAEFRRHFAARAWELFLLDYLLRAGARLTRSPERGPDFCAWLPGVGRFWVECVVPSAGEGEDAAPARLTKQTVSTLGAEDKIVLRYTNALQGKFEKIAGYRATAIIQEAEPVLVAINQGAIDEAEMYDADVPLMVRVLFGLGDLAARVNPGKGATTLVRPPMPSVTKQNGSSVATALFVRAVSAAVSGVLFARTSVPNFMSGSRHPLYLVHRPSAAPRFPIGVLPLTGEAWVDEAAGRLLHAGRMSEYGSLGKRRRWLRREPSGTK